MKNAIYLDYNATTPVAPTVREAVTQSMADSWGNPSSSHEAGKRAAEVLETARSRVADLLGARPDEIVFTSGGTESNNIVILGAARAASRGRHIVTTRIEHPALLNPCIHLLERGWDVTFVPVDAKGLVDPGDIRKAVRKDTALVSVMLANNETGSVQPVAEIARIARELEVLVHTDAAQAVGKIPVSVSQLGVDYLSVAGHKLYAPKGIGALYVRRGAPYRTILFGAGQETGRRPGTEPVPAAVGLGAACDFVSADLSTEMERQIKLRERLYQGLSGLGRPVLRHGEPDRTLPNTLSMSFAGTEARSLLDNTPEIMASTGAACHDRDVKVSHVLDAMGLSADAALGTIRFSLGRRTTPEEIERVLEIFAEILR